MPKDLVFEKPANSSVLHQNNIYDYSLNDLLFAFWFKQKGEILSKNNGQWKTIGHPNSNIEHILIDKELDRLRPLRNPNLSISLLD